MDTAIFTAARRAAFFRSGTAILALIAGTPAFAADEAAETSAGYADDGGGIVVTARRREESAQDVPIALSVVGAETLERTGNFTLTQVQQLVPSLQVSGSNARNSNVNIRGLGANSAVAADGLEYGVGFYVDGVYYGRPGQAQFDLIDIQQIEVLRGPQGTLFGKNTTAGALNITTKAPSFDPELNVEGTVGNYKYHQIRASGSIPIIADKIAVRLSIADTHRDGFLTNTYDGSDALNYDNFTARGQILIKPAETVTVRLIGDYSSQKIHGMLQLFDGYFTKYANGATIGNNIFDRAARLGFTLPHPGIFRREGNSNSHFQANMKSYGVSGQVDWDLGSATLTSVTAYRWWDWYPANDVDGTPYSINTKAQLVDFQRQFSQEVRIASSGENNKIDYVAGLFYYWQKIRGYGVTGYGSDFAEWNYNPAQLSPANIAVRDYALSGFEAPNFSNPATKSYAAFGQVDWHISSPLTLTVGLRYTHEEKKGRYEQKWSAGNDISLLPTQADRDLATATRSGVSPVLAFSASNKADAVTGLATLAYKVTPDALVYATYSRGNKSGGLNLIAGGAFRPVVKPEKVNAFELGFKTQLLGGKLIFNADAFLTEVKDYQTTISEQVGTTTQTIQYIANIPKARSKGVEADVNFALSKGLHLSAAAAYTDAKYVDYKNAPQATERSNTGVIQDLSGARLSGVSKFAYTLSADVAKPVGNDLELYARADYLHRSSFNSSATDSAYSVIPGYGVLNGRIGLRISEGQIDLSIWARNLANKNYYLSRAAGPFGLISGTPGEPRTIGGTLRVNW